MKRTILAVLAVLFLFAPLSRAQSTTPTTNPAVIYPAPLNEYDNHVRGTFGFTGGSIYGNDFLDMSVGVEAPFAKRFEADASYTFTPIEHKIGIGFGTAQGYRVGGIVWVLKNLGVNGSFVHSSYNVAQKGAPNLAKAGEDVFGGLTYRRIAWGVPVRFTFDYVRQINNKCADIVYVGSKPVNCIESNYLQGGDFNMVARMGSKGPFIIRMVMDLQVGRVKNQGNPQCDGTFGGPDICPQTSTTAGGASGGVVFEFPRHRGYEDSPF
jgi:hypothetical protein